MKNVIQRNKRAAALWLLAAGAFLMPEGLRAQDTLTLDVCYKLAEQNYPLSSQTALLAGSNALKVKNLNKNYLPQFNLNGQASYQSDVTVVELNPPAGFPPLEMPVLSKDWYKATLDISQSIWDGNVTGYQKKVESYNLQVDQTNIQAQLYQLKERVNQFFFAIVLLNENEKLLNSSKNQLTEKLREIDAGIFYGVVLQSAADAIKAELINLDQRLDEIRIDRATAYKMLSDLLSTTVTESTVLALPTQVLNSLNYENKRLENQVFDLQRARLEVLRNMVTTKWNPKFYAFGQGGIGRPGLNMLSNDLEPFYIVGVKATWTPWNWNVNKQEKKILDIQSNIIHTQQLTFDKNLKIQSERDIGEIQKALVALGKDQEIIALRERISVSASHQLNNGVITSSDYVNRLTEERQAKLNYEIHRIQLIKAQLSYLFNQGKL
ncbi:MAG: TolC family protein [bacterium]